MTRVKIRSIEVKDAPDIVEIVSQEKSFHTSLFIPYPSLQDWEERIRVPLKNRKMLVAQLENKVVGYVHLTVGEGRLKHIGNIGLVVHADHTGLGIGTELMKAIVNYGERWLGLKRLELNVMRDSLAAIHIYKKLGFVQEGVHKCHMLRDGEYVDSISMAKINPLLKGTDEL